MTPPGGSAATAPIAYLCSRYPAVSHTFVLGEVVALRARGLPIAVASINAPDRPQAQLSDTERREADATFYVKRQGVVGALSALGATLLRRPGACLGALGWVVREAGPDLRRLALGLAYLAEAVIVGRWMERLGARHLHVHFANPASVVGALVRRVFPVTLSLTIHGSPPFHDEPGTWFPATATSADFIGCISRFSRSQVWLRLPARQWDKVEITPMGVDTRRFTPAAGAVPGSPPAEGAAPPPSPAGGLRLLSVGRLANVKGFPILLEAVAKARAQGHDVRLRLVGDGPERPLLEALATALGLLPHVEFAGVVPHERLVDHYRWADAFALASFTEGVPVVLMEAMACALPSVATAVAGIPELIRDGQDGLLVPPGDADALAGSLGALALDPGRRQRIGRSARERVVALHEAEAVADRVHEVFTRRLARLAEPV